MHRDMTSNRQEHENSSKRIPKYILFRTDALFLKRVPFQNYLSNMCGGRLEKENRKYRQGRLENQKSLQCSSSYKVRKHLVQTLQLKHLELRACSRSEGQLDMKYLVQAQSILQLLFSQCATLKLWQTKHQVTCPKSQDWQKWSQDSDSRPSDLQVCLSAPPVSGSSSETKTITLPASQVDVRITQAIHVRYTNILIQLLAYNRCLIAVNCHYHQYQYYHLHCATMGKNTTEMNLAYNLTCPPSM